MAADLTRVESFQYPSGHTSHLSENQQAQLEEFKQLCQAGGYYHPAGVDGRTEPSHDDETLLYDFLVAIHPSRAKRRALQPLIPLADAFCAPVVLCPQKPTSSSTTLRNGAKRTILTICS